MKTKRNIPRSERGQAIVILAAGMVTLLAFFALAVDGSMYYSERRSAQGAADAAAITAANALCKGEDLDQAAKFIASQNGYDNNGTTNTVTVYDPPVNGAYAGQENYVEVVITTDTPATVASLVGASTLSSTVHAVAYCGTTGSSSSTYTHSEITNAGVVLLQKTGNVLTMNSNGRIQVESGSLFINSSDSHALILNSNAQLNVGEINVVGGILVNSNGHMSTTPNTGVDQLVDVDIFPDLVPPPKPSGTCQWITVNSNATLTLDPGLYCGISANSNATINLNPGIYWIESGYFNLNSNSVLNADTGVMFYFGPGAGTLQMNSNTELNIVPLQSGPYAGLAIYQDNSANFNLNSNADLTSLQGTFYLPNSTLQINSNGTLRLEAQIIAKNLTVNSNGEIIVNYGDSLTYAQEESVTSISLAE